MNPRSGQDGDDDDAGFTLLEALAAIALMATILAALATLTGQWLPNWNRGLTRVQQDERTALALERIIADLGAAEFLPFGRDSRLPLFDGTEHAVAFVRTTFVPNAPAGLEIVRIAEVAAEKGADLVRTRAAFMPVKAGGSDKDQPIFNDPVVLMRAPIRLSFAYAGSDRVWRENWRAQMQLPSAIRLTLRDGLTRRVLATSTTAIVHGQLPADCIFAKSAAECLDPRFRGTAANAGRAGGSSQLQ